jgi:sulfhydrogenase subunit alpha
MGIDPSPQTKQLRRIMCVSQIVASHIVHLYMFALPDYSGYSGFMDMIPRYEKETKNFLKMKEAMNRVGEVIGGRALNPISMVVNGFTQLPDKKSLLLLAEGIEKVIPMARETLYLMSRLSYPELKPPDTEFVTLRSEKEYAVNEGRLISSRGLDLDIHDYPSVFLEHQEAYAMAKKSNIKGRGTFMVGALARVNQKIDQFHEETKKLAQEIDFRVPNHNPFHNNIAQALEIHNGMRECVRLLSEISPQKEKSSVEIRSGEGMAITEAPRGLLMHSYAVNSHGVVEKANLVTPTSHNFANIERDLRLLALQYSAPDEHGDLRLKCEQLIRAYDPCFSCSVH